MSRSVIKQFTAQRFAPWYHSAAKCASLPWKIANKLAASLSVAGAIARCSRQETISELSSSTYRHHQISLVGSLALAVCTVGAWIQPAQATRPLDALNTHDAPSTSSNYTAGGDDYTFGNGRDLILDSLVTGGVTYAPQDVADRIVLRRADNSNSTGERCRIFAETGNGSGDYNYNPTFPIDASGDCSMEAVWSGFIINRGVLDPLRNTNSGTERANNIERVDFIYTNGLSVPTNPAELDIAGHIVMEKSHNNPFSIAAITKLDASGEPIEFGPVIDVSTSEYGRTNIRLRQDFMENEADPPQGFPTRYSNTREWVGGVLVTLEDLRLDDLGVNTYYGFVLIANDVNPSNNDPTLPSFDASYLADWTDQSKFPRDTSGSSGGADFYGGTAGFFKSVPAGITISGTLYEDTDGQGDFDSSTEPTLPTGITVNLLNSDSTPTGQTAVTREDGTYQFFGVADGNYLIQVDTSDPEIPTGLSVNTGNDLAVTVSGSPVTGQDFGFAIAPNQLPSRSCSAAFSDFDWSQLAWTDGELGPNSFTVDGVTYTVEVSNPNNHGFTDNSPKIGNNNFNDPALFFRADMVGGGYIEVIVTTDRPITGVEGIVDDVDEREPSGWQDEVVITGYLGATPVIPTLSAFDSDNVVVAGNVATGQTGDNFPTGGGHGADVAFGFGDQPIDRFVVRYRPGPDFVHGSAQHVTLNSWSFCADAVSHTISGNLYEDSDGNDTFDNGEPTLPNDIEVILYKDTNNNGDYDLGEEEQTTNTTGGNGNYSFTDVTDDTYRVYVNTSDADIPSNLTLGTPNDVEVVVSGADETDIDFGFDVLTCSLGSGTVDSNIAPIISDEVRGNNATTRDIVDGLDDSWRTAVGLPQTGTVQPWFGTAQALTNDEPNLFTYQIDGSDVSVGVALVNLDDGNDCDGTVNTGSSPELDDDNTLQNNAPRPSSLYDTDLGTSNGHPSMWNETVGSTSSPNGVLLTFSEPVRAFGAWFGDMETRTDGNGAAAYLRLLDVNGDRIGADIAIEPTNLISSSGTTPVNQANCGESPGTEVGCGNSSTRWVSFVDNAATPRVKQVLVIVGDDDATGDAGAEHLSFIGANIAVASDPNVLLVKRMTAINTEVFTDFVDGLSTVASTEANYVPAPYDDDDNATNWPANFLQGIIAGETVLPDDEVEYTIYFLSNGDTAARDVLMCDFVPSHTTFIPNTYNDGPAQDDGTLTGAGLIGADLGMVLNIGGQEFSLTNAADSDGGTYFPPGVNPADTFPNIDCEGDGNGTASNNNGAVVLSVGDLPNATDVGDPSDSYGYFRFRGRVK